MSHVTRVTPTDYTALLDDTHPPTPPHTHAHAHYAVHTGVQAKRSAWGYQHMSRFWMKTIFQHARVAELEFYLRLDTDSLLLSPLLDLFADAAHRYECVYGRQKS